MGYSRVGKGRIAGLGLGLAQRNVLAKYFSACVAGVSHWRSFVLENCRELPTGGLCCRIKCRVKANSAQESQCPAQESQPRAQAQHRSQQLVNLWTLLRGRLPRQLWLKFLSRPKIQIRLAPPHCPPQHCPPPHCPKPWHRLKLQRLQKHQRCLCPHLRPKFLSMTETAIFACAEPDGFSADPVAKIWLWPIRIYTWTKSG